MSRSVHEAAADEMHLVLSQWVGALRFAYAPYDYCFAAECE